MAQATSMPYGPPNRPFRGLWYWASDLPVSGLFRVTLTWALDAFLRHVFEQNCAVDLTAWNDPPHVRQGIEFIGSSFLSVCGVWGEKAPRQGL